MIHVRVREREAQAKSTEPITAGSVGLQVGFRFSDDWGELAKCAVFRGSGVSIDVALLDDACAVPAEVLAQAGGHLKIGVYGCVVDDNEDLAEATPTIWADAGVICEGAEPSGIEPTPQTAELVDQILAAAQAAQEAAEDAAEIAQSVRDDADSGAFDGEDGAPGRDGAAGSDGYSPTVTITDITGGHRVTITDKNGAHSFDVMDGQGGSGGSSDYSDLTNKPKINGVTLEGNKTLAQIGAGTYSVPSGGIPKTDLASDVQTSLGKADTALQQHQSLSDYRTASAQDLIDQEQDAAIAGKLPATGNAYRAVSIPMGHLDAASTATVMTATVTGITELRDGVCVWLTNGVIASASGVTLNVNGLGAKPIYNSLTGALVTTTFTAASTYLFVYNSTRITGGCWDMVYGYDTNTTYTPVKLGFGYTTCSTAEATAAKTAALSSYTLTANGIVSVKFTNAVGAGATLNINSKGAKAIHYRGAAITDGIIKAGDTATFIYSTYYHLIAIDRANPTKTSELTNDSGFLTQHQDISGKLDKSQGVAHAGEFCVVGSDGNITTVAMSAWQGGNY